MSVCSKRQELNGNWLAQIRVGDLLTKYVNGYPVKLCQGEDLIELNISHENPWIPKYLTTTQKKAECFRKIFYEHTFSLNAKYFLFYLSYS